MFKNNIHAFLLSSSLPAIATTMLYLGYGYAKEKRPNDMPYELFSLLIPLAFGIFGIINYNAIYFGSYNSLIVGAIFGFILSFIGRYWFDIPEKLFCMKGTRQRIVHLYAPVLYSLIFYMIISPMQDLLIV